MRRGARKAVLEDLEYAEALLRQDLEIRDNLRTNFHQPELTPPHGRTIEKIIDKTIEKKRPARATKP